MGNITASFSASLAATKPATSSHFTFGFSFKIAPFNESFNFFVSLSLSSPSLNFFELPFFPPPCAIGCFFLFF
jgi:hypothetical protein